MKQSRPKVLLLLLAMACALCHVHSEDLEDDPTEEGAGVVSLEHVDQPLETLAPNSQFIVPDGEELWRKARARAYDASPEHGGGFFNTSDLVGEGFRSAKEFQTERYTEGETGGELQYVIAAEEASKEGTKILLTRMRLVYFIGLETPVKKDASKPAGPAKAATKPGADGPPKAKPKKQNKTKAEDPKAGAHPAHKPKDENAKKDPAKKEKPGGGAGIAAMSRGGRVVITAPEAVIDTVTNEGLAKGNVTIEVFEKAADGGTGELIAVMKSERMRWRTWGEAAVGSTELAIYSCSEKAGEPDPIVTGTYFMKQPDASQSTMVVEGRGMVYETGTFDRPNEVTDEDGRTTGLSTVSRNRAVFHRDIKMDTTATTMAAIMPFQNETPPANAASKPPAGKKTAQPPPPPPSRTIVNCDGPAEFDLAAVPRKSDAPDSVPELIQLARRFDFLNHVRMKKVILPDPLAKVPLPPEQPTEMSCQHLRIQYAPGAMPSPSTFPEYSEAVGGVNMRGMDAGTPPPEGSGLPMPVPAAFSMDCNRLYFEGKSDNLFLVGTAAKPAEFKHAIKGDGSAQQFCYRRLTQTLTMPSNGPKRMVIHPEASNPGGAPKPAGAEAAQSTFSLGSSDTIITWNGPLSRELKHLPVPGQPDRVKEVLILKDHVFIEQPTGALKMRSENIRVVRNSVDGLVEFIEGIGGVDASLGQMQAKGVHLSVDMAYAPTGELTKNITTVVGSRAKKLKATLFMEGSAIRSDKFIIDRVKNTFESFGGAVAVVRNAQPDQPAQPAQPKPETAAGAKGLIKDISFDPGGALFVQCDGEFSQDGATNTVTIRKNVMITQPGGLHLLADEVFLKLQDPVPPAADATKPANDAKPAPVVANATPANGLFNGDLQSIDCRGTVELTTQDQLIQCDRLFKDVVADTSLLEVNDPDNDVRVYLSEDSGSSRLLSVKRSLSLDGKTGTFKPGGLLLMLPFRAAVPAARDKESSPARMKASPKNPPAAANPATPAEQVKK